MTGHLFPISGCMYTVLSHSSRVRLFAIPRTVARQALLSMGILQARILEWVAMPPSRDRTQVSHIAGRFFFLLPESPEEPKNTGVGSLSLL